MGQRELTRLNRTRCELHAIQLFESFHGGGEDRQARQLHFPWLNLEMVRLAMFERAVRVPRVTHRLRDCVRRAVREGHVRTAPSWVCFGSPKYQLEMETSPFMLIPASLKLSRSSHCSLLSLGTQWASPTLLASCAPYPSRSSGYQSGRQRSR